MKERETKYYITVPITFSITGLSTESTDEVLDRAERIIDYKLMNGEYDYNEKDMEISKKFVQYTEAEWKKMLEEWHKFIGDLK